MAQAPAARPRFTVAEPVLLYALVINVLAFVLFGIDKRRAVYHHWRIPESTLIAVAVLGGCVGSYAGMRVFHHKTKKPLFRYGIPVIILLWLIVLYLLWKTTRGI